jgi:hypothetical protein
MRSNIVVHIDRASVAGTVPTTAKPIPILRPTLSLSILVLHSLLVLPFILLFVLVRYILNLPLPSALNTPSCIVYLERLLSRRLAVLLTYAVDFGPARIRICGLTMRSGAAVDRAGGGRCAEGLKGGVRVGHVK